jgi:hypothetical protein
MGVKDLMGITLAKRIKMGQTTVIEKTIKLENESRWGESSRIKVGRIITNRGKSGSS